MEDYRSKFLFVLLFGIGGTVSIGILHLISHHLPEILDKGRQSDGWLDILIAWWAGGAVGVATLGPFNSFHRHVVRRGGEKSRSNSQEQHQ